MSYLPGDTFSSYFPTDSPTTGGATNPDAGGGPTLTLYRNETLDPAVSFTTTNALDASSNPIAGLFSTKCTIPLTYKAKDRISIVAKATVGGVTSYFTVAEFVLDVGFSILASVNDSAPTKTGFKIQSGLNPGIARGFLVFTEGSANYPEALPIASYDNNSGAVTFAQPGFVSLPVNNDPCMLIGFYQ